MADKIFALNIQNEILFRQKKPSSHYKQTNVVYSNIAKANNEDAICRT